MEAVVRSDADKAADLILVAKVLEIFGERKIGQRVAVVGEKDPVFPEVGLDGFEALADVGVETGVCERDLPPLDIAAVQPDLLRAAGELEVVRQAFVIVEEVLLDEIATIPETENELGVAEVRIVLHEMPDDRSVADVDHRLWHRFRVLPESRAKASAEQHDLHRRFRPSVVRQLANSTRSSSAASHPRGRWPGDP